MRESVCVCGRISFKPHMVGSKIRWLKGAGEEYRKGGRGEQEGGKGEQEGGGGKWEGRE